AARQARDDAKRLLMSGIDPAVERKQSKAEQETRSNSFRVIAEEYVAKLKLEGRAEATITKTEWLLSFAYPMIGDLPIRDIAVPAVLQVLPGGEVRGRYDSARRLRSTVGSVFRYAIATARADADPTIALRDALIRPTVTPRAAVTDPKALGALM